ncbi:MAG: LptF/LptG family permease [Tannerellaceae bacterium]|jgi:lipopolysaccharide export system permease protein|nr:LptF/LptG family permease [Tannerellaceae bacterium]
MLKLKRLYTFMLQTFFPLFIMTFGICLFIVLMQFLWKYIDLMVGKGLDMLVLGEMFFYAALSLVPLALPLAILLASLMTFGNLGERLELLAMKSAGVSLIHIMRPLIIFVAFVCVGAFFFQNNVLPVVQTKLYALLYSMRQKSPELDIPEGVFYKDIPNFSVYIKEKDPRTGLLKNVKIYDYSEGFINVRIILADSGRLKTSADKLFLVLTLYNGESFENLKKQSSAIQIKEAVPYRRESFETKDILIEFDANFIRTDESLFQNQYLGKNLADLQLFIDSVAVRVDSIKNLNANILYNNSYKKSIETPLPVVHPLNEANEQGTPEEASAAITLYYDSLYLAESPGNKVALLNRTKSAIENVKNEYVFKAMVIGEEAYKLRRHFTEWHSKFTVLYTCLAFFFIGAPLGAIIRKGGLGMPVVISVLLFIFYHIVYNTGFKMARDGVWQAWQGMWLGAFFLTPLGLFLTYKAVNDSVILNADTYLNALKNIIGKRSSRKIERKEVIIFTPDYPSLVSRLGRLTDTCQAYLSKHRRWLNYIAYWKEGGKDPAAEQITKEMETIIEELGNSDQNLILNKLMDYPVIGGYKQLGAHLNKTACLCIGGFLPLGLFIYFFAIYQRKLLRQDIRTVQAVSDELKEMINDLKTRENI